MPRGGLNSTGWPPTVAAARSYIRRNIHHFLFDAHSRSAWRRGGHGQYRTARQIEREMDAKKNSDRYRAHEAECIQHAERAIDDATRRKLEILAHRWGYLVTDPDHWRERAESIRVTANSINDAGTKARMLKIAEGYEALRRQTEERKR
jgi:hypothetical protein